MTLPELPAPPTGPVARARLALADGWTVARRLVSHVWRVPENLIASLVLPAVFVLLFGYVFGSAIRVPGGGNYREFLMPGIFVQSMAFATVAASVGIAEDAARGIMDRFRSLPMARSAVLFGHTAFHLLRAVFALLVLVACGLAVGWRMDGGAGHALAAFGLLLLFQFSMIWVGALIGLLVRTPETADSATFAWLFPLTFVANTFVPTGGMPPWMRAIADWNPMSATAAACRELFGNPNPLQADAAWPLQHPVLASVGWSLLILAVFAPLAVRRYRTASDR